MIALVRMRLTAYLRTGRFVGPAVAWILLLTILYAGGTGAAAEAYAASGLLLFPVTAWQAKAIVDVEPDAQRRLVRASFGTREWIAGPVAAAVAGAFLALPALPLPSLFGAPWADTGAALAGGVWLHVLVALFGAAAGALASRPLTGSAGRGVLALCTVVVAGIVLGARHAPLPWLGPISPAAPLLTNPADAAAYTVATVRALLWTAAVAALYGALRRRRA